MGFPLWAWLFVFPSILALLSRIFRAPLQDRLKPLWRIMDKIYRGSGLVAAVFMMTILAIIIVQMITRWVGLPFQGSTEFAGYAMAATSFFALSYALTTGAHIRVSILLNINHFTKMWMDVFALLLGAITATYFARFAIKTNFMSKILNDRTQGQDQVPDWVLAFFGMFKTSPAEWGQLWSGTTGEWVFTPVWLPQLPMSVGTILLAVALWDYLIRLLINGESAIKGETVE
jgi:TRAP-type C4-dicarboxylate transport system permease small subunit